MLFPYRAVTRPTSKAQWREDYQTAQKIKDVRFGKEFLHLGRMAELGGSYLPYSDIVRWYISVEAAVGGEATFHIYRLVVNYGERGELAGALGEVSANLNEQTPLEAVQKRMAEHPDIPVGRDYTRPSRFRSGK